MGGLLPKQQNRWLHQRIREAERSIIYEEFIDREEDIVTGIVQRSDGRNTFIDLGRVEAILPHNELMPGKRFKHGDRCEDLHYQSGEVNEGTPNLCFSDASGITSDAYLNWRFQRYMMVSWRLSRSHREAGQRSKIAVHTRDEQVDPVGACVGHRGVRVQTVVNELRGEKIDIVRWSEDPAEYVANSLSPSKVLHVDIDEEEKVARVTVPDHQLSLAIGKEGQNARLAAKLTNWKIDIKNESESE